MRARLCTAFKRTEAVWRVSQPWPSGCLLALAVGPACSLLTLISTGAALAAVDGLCCPSSSCAMASKDLDSHRISSTDSTTCHA